MIFLSQALPSPTNFHNLGLVWQSLAMYPSNSNGNTNSTLEQTPPFSRPSLSDQNPFPSSFLHSPSPYIHYEDDLILLQYLHDLFHHHQQEPPLIEEASHPVINSSSENTHSNNEFMSLAEQLPRKRSCKKDRHSKIETAQGPRDRRMRLSLEVARKFFNLQDMLGFDKASKTVGWLLNESKTAIEELKRGFPHNKNTCSVGGNNYSASSTSECEVLSGIDESTVDENRHVISKGNGSKSLGKKKKNVRTISRKSGFDPIARESRNKARAWARERTEKKKSFDESKPSSEPVNRDMSRVRSWSPFENGEESGTHNLDLLADVEELNSSIIFNNNNGISPENHLADFQLYGKPWETYSNIDLR